MSYGKMNTNMQTKSSFIPRWICLWLSFLLWAMALPAQNNYIRTYTFGSECPPGTVPDTNSSSISTSYYDAAGRPVQTVKHSFTPQRNDMANLIDYDGLGGRYGNGATSLLTKRTELIKKEKSSSNLRMQETTMWTMNTNPTHITV